MYEIEIKNGILKVVEAERERERERESRIRAIPVRNAKRVQSKLN